jgi:hypothetical protein
MGYSALRSDINVNANCTFRAGKKIAINGNRIVLEASDSLTLKSGSVMIKLTPTKTTIKGAMKIDAGKNIKVKGNVNNLTK